MIGPLVRGTRLIHIFSVIIFSGLILSCSLKMSTPQTRTSVPAAIQDIRVSEGTEKTRVEIEGEEPMIYTTFKLSNPERLVVDIADVSLGQFSQEIAVEKGPVRKIRPGTGVGKGISRLEFEFSGAAEADVRTEGMNLIVEVVQNPEANKGFVFFEETEPAKPQTEEPLVETIPVLDEEIDDTQLNPPMPPPLSTEIVSAQDLSETPEPGDAPFVDESGDVDESIVLSKPVNTSSESPDFLSKMAEITETSADLEEEVADVPLPAAKKIREVRFDEGENLKLLVQSDGTLSPRAFFIGTGEKQRLVIDLPDVKMTSFKSRVSVADSRVKQARIGQHEKKLRLVLDLSAPISYAMAQNGGDLTVLIKNPSEAGDDLSETVSEDLGIAGESSENIAKVDQNTPETVQTAFVSEEASLLTDEDIEKTPHADHEEMTGPDVENVPPVEKPKMALSLASPDVAEAAELPVPVPAPETENAEMDTPESEKESISDTVSSSPKTAEALAGKPKPLENGEKDPLPLVAKADTEEEPRTSRGEMVQPVQVESAPKEKESVPTKEDLDDEEADTKKSQSPQMEVTAEAEKKAKKKVLLRRKRREAAQEKLETQAKVQGISESAVPAEDEMSKYTGRKISLDFQDAEITNVVRLIADVSGLNFVIGDDVKGQITVKMDNVPWDQALEIILDIRNLGMEREGDIIRIATLANLTKQRDEKAKALETKIRAEELLTRVVYINYGTAEKMKSLLLKLLSSRGEIMVASRVNALVVKDIVANLDQVEEMAKRLDTKTPQVLIEARVVEVQPNFKRSLGVKWGADFKTNNGGNSIGIGNSGGDVGVFSQGPDFAVNLPAATPLGGIGFSFGRFTESPFQLDLRLSAGESQEMTRIVSTPKIMVLDNNEALIKQGSQIPFQSSSANGGTNVQLIDASLQLKVIPHISTDGGILLDLELTKNEPGPPVQGSQQPSIFEKEVNTQVLLMDGETMVIGGIYETKSTESESGIPWLKDIPGLGWLFKNKEKSESTTELLIFITPTVMK